MRSLGFFIIFLCLMFPSRTESQCLFQDLFPIEMGMTRFEVMKTLLNNSSFLKITDQHQYWYKSEDSSINDSILVDKIFFEFKHCPCFSGFGNSGFVFLSNDKLYLISYTVFFEPEKSSNGMSYYNEIINMISKYYSIKIELERKSGRSGKTIGEGYQFFNNLKDIGTSQAEDITVSYLINPKVSWNSKTNSFYDEPEIESFVVEIDFRNLKLTDIHLNPDEINK